MRRPGMWGPKEFAEITENELHETMIGAFDFLWAQAKSAGANAISRFVGLSLPMARDPSERHGRALRKDHIAPVCRR